MNTCLVELLVKKGNYNGALKHVRDETDIKLYVKRAKVDDIIKLYAEYQGPHVIIDVLFELSKNAALTYIIDNYNLDALQLLLNNSSGRISIAETMRYINKYKLIQIAIDHNNKFIASYLLKSKDTKTIIDNLLTECKSSCGCCEPPISDLSRNKYITYITNIIDIVPYITSKRYEKLMAFPDIVYNIATSNISSVDRYLLIKFIFQHIINNDINILIIKSLTESMKVDYIKNSTNALESIYPWDKLVYKITAYKSTNTCGFNLTTSQHLATDCYSSTPYYNIIGELLTIILIRFDIEVDHRLLYIQYADLYPAMLRQTHIRWIQVILHLWVDTKCYSLMTDEKLVYELNHLDTNALDVIKKYQHRIISTSRIVCEALYKLDIVDSTVVIDTLAEYDIISKCDICFEPCKDLIDHKCSIKYCLKCIHKCASINGNKCSVCKKSLSAESYIDDKSNIDNRSEILTTRVTQQPLAGAMRGEELDRHHSGSSPPRDLSRISDMLTVPRTSNIAIGTSSNIAIGTSSNIAIDDSLPLLEEIPYDEELTRYMEINGINRIYEVHTGRQRGVSSGQYVDPMLTEIVD